MTVIYWLAAAVVFVVIEILTMGLTTIWFAGGALLAAAAAFFGLPLWTQVLIFAIVSLLLLIPLRPWAQAHLNSNTEKTNVDSLIGQTAIVTETIDNLNAKGQAKLKGQSWTARSISDEMIISEGTKVKVEEISGVKIIVRPFETAKGE